MNLTTLKNKIPDISNLVKKTDYNTKIAEIDDKFDEIKQSVLDSLIFLSVGNLLLAEGGGTQAYLIFQPVYKYFRFISNTNYISSWKSKGLSDESIKPFPTSNNTFTPLIEYYNGYRIRAKFNRSILRQPKVTYTHKKVVNIYIVYEFSASGSNDDDPTLRNCLFRAVTLTKNADIEKYGYSGYGPGFDRRGSFSFRGGRYGQNVLVFGADMSSSAHIDNKKKTY